MYLTDLLNVVGCQLSGVTISGSPLVDRLIEERVVMERIKPLEDKITYKTEKLTKMASGKMAEDDPLNQKPADIDDIDFGWILNSLFFFQFLIQALMKEKWKMKNEQRKNQQENM